MSLFLPELFYQITTNLNDREKIFLSLCSKIMYNFKSLLVLNLEYNIEEINDRWNIKNILIKDFTLENKIKELIKDLIPESIVINSNYVKFISNNANIRLFHSEEIIKILASYECYSHLVMKIILNSVEPVYDINDQFIKMSHYGYLSMVKLLMDSGANIRIWGNIAIIEASYGNHLDVVKLLIDYGADVNARDTQAIIVASHKGHLSMVKLLIDCGANVSAQNNQAIIDASRGEHLSIVKLLIDYGADINQESGNR